MSLIDEAARRGASTTPWARRSRFPAARPPTPLSASRVSAARAAFVGKVKDDTLGRVLHPRHPRRRRRLHHASRQRRPVDRALLHPGHARRRAHHEHLSRRRAESAARRHRRRDGRGRRRSPILKAICGIRRTPRRRSSRRRRSRTRPSARWRSPCRTRSASTATARNFRRWCATARSISLFANESELQIALSDRGFRHRGRRRCATMRSSPRSRAARKAAWWSAARRRRPCRPARSNGSSIRRARAICLPPDFSTASRADADIAPAARLGALAAAEVIQHLGARPETALATLAADNGLAL